MNERRKHKRLPVLKDMAEPIELTMIDSHFHSRQVPGVITNLSAGGMDLVLMEAIKGTPSLKLNMHLPGLDRFEVEGNIVWNRPKEHTSVVGIQFTKIDPDHQKQLTHMGEAHWECEERIRSESQTICFHGCANWDLCEKPAKLKHVKKPSIA